MITLKCQLNKLFSLRLINFIELAAKLKLEANKLLVSDLIMPNCLLESVQILVTSSKL